MASNNNYQPPSPPPSYPSLSPAHPPNHLPPQLQSAFNPQAYVLLRGNAQLNNDPTNPSSFVGPLNLNIPHPPILTDGPQSLYRHPIRNYAAEAEIARRRRNEHNTQVPAPRFPTQRNDFPGPAADGDPEINPYGPVDGPRWSDDEFSHFVRSAMEIKYPPNTQGAAEARQRDEKNAAAAAVEKLDGLEQEAEALVELKRVEREGCEAWHTEWLELQRELADKARELRGAYNRNVEDVHVAHHHRRRGRLSPDRYTEVKNTLVSRLYVTFDYIRDVAYGMGIAYAIRMAVRQGVMQACDGRERGLDITSCDPRAYLEATFPELVAPEHPVPVDDMAPVDLPLPAQPATLNTSALLDTWEGGRDRLRAVYRAALAARWAEVHEGTRAEAAMLGRLFGRGQ